MRKKGVSPLIATVLLIAFAVALGAVVMNWGSDYVRSQAESTGQKSDVKIKCAQDVAMSIPEIDDVPKLCYNNETDAERVEFLLSNDGNERIVSVRIMVTSNISDVQSAFINESIDIGEIRFLNITYDEETSGKVKLLTVRPRIRVNGLVKPAWCPQNELEKDEVPTCTN